MKGCLSIYLGDTPIFPEMFHTDIVKNRVAQWQGRQDLNPQPTDLESVAPPMELLPCFLLNNVTNNRGDFPAPALLNISEDNRPL